MVKDIGELRARSVFFRLKDGLESCGYPLTCVMLKDMGELRAKLQVEDKAGELRLPTNLCDGEGHGRVECEFCLLQVEGQAGELRL
jgi:hypothetical protein